MSTLAITENFIFIKVKVLNAVIYQCLVYINQKTLVEEVMSKIEFELGKVYQESDNPNIVIGGDFNCRVGNGGGIEKYQLPYSTVFSKSHRSMDREVN